MALTYETQNLLAQIITQQAMQIRETEIQKEVLAQDRHFVALNAFMRLDRRNKGQISTLDLACFFRDNKLVVSEADCYMLVKQFDSNSDGLLNLLDVMLILCPRTYTYTKNFVKSKKEIGYAHANTGLSYAMEYAVLSVLQK